MNVFEWVERSPVICFICASLVLIYLYGTCWTVVLLFTIYLIDESFKDTEEEKIYGKQLFNASVTSETKSSNKTYNKRYITSTYNNMFTNCKTYTGEKRPSLQQLVNRTKTRKENTVRSERQPLAAIVKNNMNIHLSNIDLEKKKPLYQCIRSTSPSMNSTRLSRNNAGASCNQGDGSYFASYNNTLPFLNRSNLNGSPSSSLNRSNLNVSSNLSVNNSVVSPLNDSLEVHGSYFINKSVLHSPSSERSITNAHPSPSQITFHKKITNSVSKPIICSTESVVEALKQKIKRKRVLVESSSDECNTKKKKADKDVDSTLIDLLPCRESPIIQQVQTQKRKKCIEKDVISTGVQCIINEDETVIKKTKIQTKDEISHQKYGLSQDQINKLSDETHSTNDVVKTEQKSGEEINDEKNESPMKISQDSVRSTAYDCSFKSVSFASSTPDKDSNDSNNDSKEDSIQKSNLKLSALKNMDSPYKRLFRKGPMKNVTPESIKKMRKHPIYFTAKINIDEIQQHREEYGQSGVSLKAFRLDQEEAKKRIDSLFEENDSDVDFKLQPTSEISTVISTIGTSIITTSISSGVASSSVATTLLTSSSIKSNLFGSTGSSAVISSSSTISSSTFSFGSLTSTASLPSVTTVTVSKAQATLITSAPTTGGFQLQQKNSVVTETTQTLPPSSVSISVTPAAFNFNPSPAANFPASTMPRSTTGITVLPTQSATSDSTNILYQMSSNPSNFNFGASGGSNVSVVHPSLQFATLQSTTVSSVPVIPDSNKVSFTVGAKPVTQNRTDVPSTLAASNPIATQLNFSFPPQAANSTQSNQNTTVLAAPINVQPTAVSSNGLFGANTSSSFNFGATSVASVPKGMSTSVSSSGFSFSPAVVSNNTPNVAPISSTVPTQSSIFGSAASIPSAGIFNQTTTSSVGVNLGNPGNIFVPQNKVIGFSLPSTTAPSTGFSFSSTAAPPPSFSLGSTTAPSTGFSFSSTTAPATRFSLPSTTAPSTGFSFSSTTAPSTGFSFASSAAPSTGFSLPSTTAPSTGFNFGASSSQTNAVSSVSNGFNASNPSVAQPNIFGQPAPATNLQAPQNIFGAPTASATSSQSIFGAPASMSSTQNMFGVPASSAPSTQNMFGNTSQNTFGSNSQNTFGSSSNQNVFGATQQQPSMFGEQSKISSGFNFGSTAVTTAPTGGFSFGTNTTNAVFGQSNNVFGGSTATNNTGVFGATKPVENPFGQQQPKPSTGFDFSSSLSQGPTINFGGAAAAPTVNAFSAQQPNEVPKPSFNFGSQPATPTFGATPASPAFGNIQQPTFGSPQPFGNPGLNPAAGGGFTIGAGTSNPPPTRQTQRARRRLRR